METLMTKSRSNPDVGRCLRIAQAKYDVKSADLARALGTFPQQVVRWRATKDMRVHTLKEICDHFGITVDEFLKFD